MPKSRGTKFALKSAFLITLGLLASSCAITVFAQPGSVALFAQNTERILIAEQKLGALAMEKGASEAVKNYAGIILKQDASMERSLKRAAHTVQVVLPTTVDADEQNVYGSPLEIDRCGL